MWERHTYQVVLSKNSAAVASVSNLQAGRMAKEKGLFLKEKRRKLER